jgi:hypothetical protein
MTLTPYRMSLFLLLLSNGAVAYAEEEPEIPYEERVDYDGNRISVTFDHTPLNLALNIIRERTGIEFVVPPAVENRELSLRLTRSPIEPAVRSVISSLGFENFALIYDPSGQPSRVLILNTQTPDEAAAVDADPAPSTAAGAGISDERSSIEKELKRWSELNREERVRLENRLRRLPSSPEHAELLAEYGRRNLGLQSEPAPAEY